MYKKTKHGVEIDSQAADKAMAPRFKAKRSIEDAGHEMKKNPPAQLAKNKKKFGKKRARAQKVAMMLKKARKGA